MPVQVIQGRVSADKALSVLLETELQGLWRDQILLTVPKIKQFFSKSAKEQLKMIRLMEWLIQWNCQTSLNNSN